MAPNSWLQGLVAPSTLGGMQEIKRTLPGTVTTQPHQSTLSPTTSFRHAQEVHADVGFRTSCPCSSRAPARVSASSPRSTVRGRVAGSSPVLSRSGAPPMLSSPSRVSEDPSASNRKSVGQQAACPTPPPRLASAVVSQMMPPPTSAAISRSNSVGTTASTESMITEPPPSWEPSKNISWPEKQQVNGMVQTALAGQSRHEAEQVQLVTEIINASLQKHSDYCEGQFQMIFENVRTLSESVDHKFKIIDMQLGEYSDRYMQPLQDAENAVSSVQKISSSTSLQLAAYEAQFKKMVMESKTADEEMTAMAAECRELLKLCVHSKDMDELTCRIEKLEHEDMQSRLLATGLIAPVVPEEEILKVKKHVAELSSQIQAGMKEWHAYAEHIQEFVLEKQDVQAYSHGNADGDVDAPACDDTSLIRALPFDNAWAPPGQFFKATSSDEPQAQSLERALHAESFATRCFRRHASAYPTVAKRRMQNTTA